jgi:hypothetical protein
MNDDGAPDVNDALEDRILAVMRYGNPRLDFPTLEFLIQKQEWDAHGKVLQINHFNVLDACGRLKMRGLIRDDESGDWRLGK